MILKENIPLAHYTTFKIGGPARFFCVVTSEDGLDEAVALARRERLRILVLGGGSNILVSDAGFPGVVIKNEIMGRSITPIGNLATATGYRVSVGAGELWDGVVDMCVSAGLYGLENLSAIPGTAGAAPVQNIGAYGAEVARTISMVRAFDTRKMRFIELSNKECHFGYRHSLFKEKKGRYIITRVEFLLSKQGMVDTRYKDITEYFAAKPGTNGNAAPTLADVRHAVVDIRWKKLPDWKLWGTAGSFFKNPVISRRRYDKLKAAHPGLPGFPEPDGRMKVPLGWILDRICHARGEMIGNVGTYERQALVLVTKPGATATEVVARAKELMDLVERDTGIKIEAEVEWVN